MVEQTDTGKCHCYAIFITSLYNMIITYRTSCLRYKLHTTPVRTFHIVTEWEKRIRTQRNTFQSIQPRTFLLTSQNLRLFSKELLPNTVGQYIFVIITDIDINCIVGLKSILLFLKITCYPIISMFYNTKIRPLFKITSENI